MKQTKKERRSIARQAISMSLLFVMILLAGTVGCSNKKHVFIHMDSVANSNDGRPLYVLIRGVNKKDFLVEYYDEIAELLYADEGKEQLLGWTMILPNQTKEVKIPFPDEDIAIYGMFTDPSDNWKIRIPGPLTQKSYQVAIDRRSLQQVVKKDNERGDH